MNGERLKNLRLSKGISQKRIAEILGIDRTTYLKYENGSSNPNISRLTELANFFNATPDYLLGEGEATSPIIQSEDENLNELLSLFNKMDDKLKLRLLGAAYSILAESKVKDRTDLEKLRSSVQ